MTPAEFKQARRDLGLSTAQLAHILDTNPQTVRRWEAPESASTSRPPNPIATRVLAWMQSGFRPPEWPNSGGRGDVD